MNTRPLPVPTPLRKSASAFAVVAVLLVAAGWWYYLAETNFIRLQKHEEIAAIGGLKAGQILLWRRERMNDASRMAVGPLVRKAVTEFLREPDGPLRADLLERLRIEHTASGYADALIFAPDGKLLLSALEAPEPMAPATRQAIAAAVASQGPVLSDFFRHADGVVHIDSAAAVRNAAGEAVAVAVLRSDATTYLYPLIQSWPTPSRSSETFIVQREGESVVWLNEARHRTNTALSFHEPLSKTNLPAVQAALGRLGVFEGVDYRGVAVLAHLEPVSGSSWFIVSKVDVDEIFAEARSQTGRVTLVVGLLILLAAVATAFIYRQQNAADVQRLNADLARRARELEEANRALREENAERQRAEAEREQYFRLFMTSNDLMCIADPNGAFLKTNPACTRTLGYSEVELVSKPFIEFIHPEDKQPTVDEMARQQRLGYSLNFENRYRCKDGSHRWLSWRANYIPEERLTYATARDVTELKRAEQALREAGIYNRSLIEASLDPLVTISAEGRIMDVNEASAQATGLKREQLVGTDFSDYFIEPEKAREGYRRVFSEGFVRDYPLAIRHTSGRVMDVLYNASIYKDDQGRVLGVFAAARDITERKRAEEEIRQLNAGLEHRVRERTAELTAANHELESFSYAVAHDLRAPIRAMTGFSQALVEDYGRELQGEAHVFLDQIIHASRRMSELVDGLLTLSRCTRGELQRDRVDLSALCERLRAELSKTEPDRRVEWHVQPGLTAWGDARMIEVVMNNLLGNAWKYTGRQPAPVIRVYAERVNGELRFCVADNGAGFDMKHAGQLFKPFQRLHRQEEFPGIGIGLATVERILHRHGGAIRVTAAVGVGATFSFSLPETEPMRTEAS